MDATEENKKEATEELQIIATQSNLRIDIFISEQSDLNRSRAQKLLKEGRVTVGGKQIKQNYKVKEGDIINISIPPVEKLEIKAETISLDVVYEDQELIVINKPVGLVVHPAVGNYTGTLVNALLDHCQGSLSGINGVIRPGIVHRIDKDTSGLLVVAKNDGSHVSLAKQIKDKTVTREYLALVHGIVNAPKGVIDAPIGRHPVHRKKMAVVEKGRPAITHYSILERFEQYTLIKARLETGRTHQIRVHMQYIGHPVLGDPVYGPGKAHFGLTGQLLHAATLGFIHPVSEEYMEFEAPLPEGFRKILERL